MVSALLVAQNPSEQKKTNDKFKNLKILKSEQVDEIKINIRKPDNATQMPRKNLELSMFPKLEVKSRIIESNKLIY